MIIDTHCHIQFRAMDKDRDDIISRCRKHKTIMNVVGTQRETSNMAVELATQHDDIWASIGNHPSHVFPVNIVEQDSAFTSRGELFDTDYYEKLFATAPNKIIGVGETGIDLYHIPDPKEIPIQTVLEKQREVFLDHVAFAENHGLSLIIHCRDGKNGESAHDAMIQILKELNHQIHGVIHCYTGNLEHAKEYLKLGLYIGFTGIITYPPKKTDPKPQLELNEVVKNIPLNRIVVETDSPYLAPHIIRGQRNEPWYVEEVIKEFIRVRDIDQTEFETQIIENTKKLFPKMKIGE